MKIQKLLIAFEGIDGSGKTTQATRLNQSLAELSCASTIIKAKHSYQNKIFLNFIQEFHIEPDSLAFMFAYQALHRAQYEKTMKALKSGMIVISDRWNGSFFVYHSMFGQLSCMPKSVRLMLDKLAFECVDPEFTFLLDIPSHIAAKRRRGRGETVNQKEINFYKIIAQKYREMANENDWIVLDATQTKEKIHDFIIKVILNTEGQN